MIGEVIAIVGAVLLWPLVFASTKKTALGRGLIISVGIILVLAGSFISYSATDQGNDERVVDEEKQAAENARKAIRIRSSYF